MTEVRLFPEGTVPDCTTAAWYAEREHAPHLEQPDHRPRLEVAAGFVRDLIDKLEPRVRRVVDLGAGDGGLLSLLHQYSYAVEVGDVEVHGYDLMPANIAAARARGVDVWLLDVVDELANKDAGGAFGPLELGDVAVITETLEHLLDPHGFLRQLHADGTVRALVASSPWTETTGGAYEFHLWAWDGAGYSTLLEEAGWRVNARTTSGMFQVVSATRVDK